MSITVLYKVEYVSANNFCSPSYTSVMWLEQTNEKNHRTIPVKELTFM